MASNVFMSFSGEDDFKLESGADYGVTVSNAKGAIEVLDFEFKIEQIGSEEGGRPRSVESIERGELRFKKAVDSRTPLLFYFCCCGEFISEAALQFYGPSGCPPFLTYTLGYVHVASYEPSGSVNNVPTEWIGLRYGQMKVSWDQTGMGNSTYQGNSRTGTTTKEWSWVLDAPVWMKD